MQGQGRNESSMAASTGILLQAARNLRASTQTRLIQLVLFCHLVDGSHSSLNPPKRRCLILVKDNVMEWCKSWATIPVFFCIWQFWLLSMSFDVLTWTTARAQTSQRLYSTFLMRQMRKRAAHGPQYIPDFVIMTCLDVSSDSNHLASCTRSCTCRDETGLWRRFVTLWLV